MPVTSIYLCVILLPAFKGEYKKICYLVSNMCLTHILISVTVERKHGILLKCEIIFRELFIFIELCFLHKKNGQAHHWWSQFLLSW